MGAPILTSDVDVSKNGPLSGPLSFAHGSGRLFGWRVLWPGWLGALQLGGWARFGLRAGAGSAGLGGREAGSA